MRVIFLDFDGVLNSRESWDTCTQMHRDHKSARLNPPAVDRLARLVKESRAAIVVSSSWRAFWSLDQLKTWLSKFGIPKNTIIGKTPRCDVMRGREIRQWLDDHPEVTSFVVLDDDSDMETVHHRHVKTSWETGLQDDHVEEALNLFRYNQRTPPEQGIVIPE